MGQTVGRMPDTWDDLLEEKDRVLYWSGEVLSKVADNVNQEESFQIDYGNESIDRKIDSWIEAGRTSVDKTLDKRSQVSAEYNARVTSGIAKIRENCRMKMRSDYSHEYADIKKFTQRVDKLGRKQRKLHSKLQELESVCANDVKKFRRKFGPLRLETFKNLTIGEKLMFVDKKLKAEFVGRVYDVDHKNARECARGIDKLMKSLEKSVHA